MTIGLWILAIVLALLGLAFAIAAFGGCEPTTGIIILLITVILVGSIIGIGHWACNSTATGIRAMKDQESNFNNGLNREITITAEDGREIFHYKGKCDIETTNEYILFEDEDGFQKMIYRGIQDTIIVSELP